MEDAWGLFDDDDEDAADDGGSSAIFEQSSPPVAPKHPTAKRQARLGPETPSEAIRAQIQQLRGGSRVRCQPTLFIDAPPLFMGPCEYQAELAGIGGARGYAAATDVAPGEVLLSESPLVPWPDNKLGESVAIATVASVFDRPDAEFQSGG